MILDILAHEETADAAIDALQLDELLKRELRALTRNTIVPTMLRAGSQINVIPSEAEVLLDAVERKFPGLRDSIKSYYTATPLSYRDYIGNDDGSLYGIVKDYKNALKTFISPRTKLPNLYLTGQNLNLHGILGASMSAIVTCCALLDNDNVITKIRNA